MKTDTDYSSVWSCPDENRIVHPSSIMVNSFCPACGDEVESYKGHLVKVIGKWSRPSLFERARGIGLKFIPRGKSDGSLYLDRIQHIE